MVETGQILGGAVLLVVGTVMARYPYRLTLIGELLDSIGSTTDPDDVEPAEWNVNLTRFVGVVLVLVGLFVAMGGA